MPIVPMHKKIDTYITHNTHYIDYCLEQLKKDIYPSLSYISDEIITSLVQFLLSDGIESPINLSNLSKNGLCAAHDLLRLIRQWDIIKSGDIIGYIYQNIKHNTDKKKKGQYFTPSAIVKHIVDHTLQYHENIFTIKILDPACGSGQFLIFTYKLLLERYQQFGIDEKEASHLICSNNLFGYDIDPIACSIAQWNMKKISGQKTNIIRRDILDIDDIFTLPHNNEKYNIIIGNPPWGAHFTQEQKNIFRNQYYSAQSGINSFTLFIERTFFLLDESGVLSFLIPEAYLNIKAHKNSRELLLNNAIIKEIVLWGDCFKGVYAPTISITAQKESDSKKRLKNIINIKNSKTLDSISQMIPQHTYCISHEHIFSINYTRKAVSILEHIESLNYFTLKEKAKFFLGIVTGNNNHHIAPHPDDNHPHPIIIGKDIEPYKINFSGHYFKYNITTLQQVAEQHFYLNSNKIIYRFISKKLMFAVENNGYYTLNNVNGFIPVDETLDPDIIVTILNSRLMQYIYETQFFTIKVLRGNLEKLPIKKINPANCSILKKFSILLRHEENLLSRKKIMDTIDDIIFHEYNINDIHAHYIYETINSKYSIA